MKEVTEFMKPVVLILFKVCLHYNPSMNLCPFPLALPTISTPFPLYPPASISSPAPPAICPGVP